MGAGTTDISILKLSIDEYGIPHISEPLLYPSKSEPFLCGGREIDELMQQYTPEGLLEADAFGRVIYSVFVDGHEPF